MMGLFKVPAPGPRMMPKPDCLTPLGGLVSVTGIAVLPGLDTLMDSSVGLAIYEGWIG